MTIENLKQIAIKYATTKGSRVPLAPDELCNAVVQYFNEFLKITADINTIQVAVTEEGGNIVFTITGNTLDGKAFTPIVITVDHNDFVTDQEFEAFKTTINAAIQKNTESINSLSFRVEDTENDITTIQVQVGQINTRVGNTETNVTNLKNRVDNTETNIAKINSTLNNKLDKITSPMSNFVLYANIEGNDRQISATASPVPNTVICRNDIGKATIVKGVSDQDAANMENIADVEAKIPDVSGFATTEQLQEVENKIPAIPEYTSVDSVIYDTTNGAIIAYNGANEIHIPLLAGENVTIDASEDNKKIVISAAGGGGTGDVMAARHNTFTGVNTFYNSIYAKLGVVAEDTTNYGANSIRKGPNTYSFPNKSGTFAMTTDVIKNPIYFISFYANAPSEPCHLIGTMMSKNSYGTGQKTSEEFAVMLADNFYTNSNEGLAVYGKLTEKDILCIYSEDGLSIRCLDEENSEVDLPMVMFFVMETEL